MTGAIAYKQDDDEPRVPYSGREGRRVSSPLYDPFKNVALWGAVVDRALADAGMDYHNDESGSRIRDTQDAIKWLLYPGWESRQICDMADRDYAKVRKEAIFLLKPLIMRYMTKAATAKGKVRIRYTETAMLIREGCMDKPPIYAKAPAAGGDSDA